MGWRSAKLLVVAVLLAVGGYALWSQGYEAGQLARAPPPAYLYPWHPYGGLFGFWSLLHIFSLFLLFSSVARLFFWRGHGHHWHGHHPEGLDKHNRTDAPDKPVSLQAA